MPDLLHFLEDFTVITLGEKMKTWKREQRLLQSKTGHFHQMKISLESAPLYRGVFLSQLAYFGFKKDIVDSHQRRAVGTIWHIYSKGHQIYTQTGTTDKTSSEVEATSRFWGPQNKLFKWHKNKIRTKKRVSLYNHLVWENVFIMV